MIANFLLLTIPAEIRSAIIAQYDLDPTSDIYCRLFDSEDRLILRPTIDGYKQKNEQLITISDGYSNARALAANPRRELDLDLGEGRIELLMVLRRVATWQRGGSTVRSLLLRDYVLPEESDYAVGYSDRTGIITEIEATGGTSRESESITSRRLGKGVRLVFAETSRREAY